MTNDELSSIGKERYGTLRFLSLMSRDTGIPYPTLWRYAHGETKIKPLAAAAIYALKVRPSPKDCSIK